MKNRGSFSLFLVLILVVSFLSIFSFSFVSAVTSITNCVELQNIVSDINSNPNFILANDIDCSDTKNWNAGQGFRPLNLYGHTILDGQGHIINNLYINRPNQDSIGLIGLMSNGDKVTNIGLKNVSIFGNKTVSGLIAANYNRLTIDNVYVTGIINGNEAVGGLVGMNAGTMIYINLSYSDANVYGNNGVGGLVGLLLSPITISNSRALGNVIVKNLSLRNKVNGLVGGSDTIILSNVSWINGPNNDADVCYCAIAYRPTINSFCEGNETCDIPCNPNYNCYTFGQKRCSSGTGWQYCGNLFGTDNCFEWSGQISCASGQICSNGNCIIPPLTINFTSPTPANNTFSSSNHITINISASKNVSSCILNFNNTFYNMNPSQADPLKDSNTLLLMHFNGANGSTSFIDEMSHSVLKKGNARINSSAVYFDEAGSYLDINLTGAIKDNDNFTLDFWMYRDSNTGGDGKPPRRYLFDTRVLGSPMTSFYYDLAYTAAANLYFLSGGIYLSWFNSAALTTFAWHHVAIVKSGSNAYLFFDGKLVATDTSATFVASDLLKLFNIFGTYTTSSSTYNWHGYIDDLRFSNIARWTANFTPVTRTDGSIQTYFSESAFNLDLSNFSSGIYNYNVTCDGASTETRKFTKISFLSINFTSPTPENNSNVKNPVVINVSATKNVSSCNLSITNPAAKVSTPYVWVANYDSNSVSKLNITNGYTIGTYEVVQPEHLAVDKNNNVWITNSYSDNVTKINGTTGNIIGTYAIGSTRGIAVDKDNNIWVADTGKSSVVKINSDSGNIINTYYSGFGTHSLAVDKDNNIWAISYTNNNVTKINGTTGNIIGIYAVGHYPVKIVIDKNNNIWVTNLYDNNVTKLNGTNGNKIGTYATGSGPLGIAVDLDNNIWIANDGMGKVTKLNGTNGNKIGTYDSSGLHPYGVSVDQNNNIWVTNYDSNNVTKLNGTNGNKIGIYSVGGSPYSTGDATGFALQHILLGYSLEDTVNYPMQINNKDENTTSNIALTNLGEGAYNYYVNCDGIKTETRTFNVSGGGNITGASWNNLLDEKITKADLNDSVKLMVNGFNLVGEKFNFTVFRTEESSFFYFWTIIKKVNVGSLVSDKSYVVTKIDVPGNYSFSVSIMDINDNVKGILTSENLVVSEIINNANPQISIISPVCGSDYMLNDAVTFVVNISDEDDLISGYLSYNGQIFPLSDSSNSGQIILNTSGNIHLEANVSDERDGFARTVSNIMVVDPTKDDFYLAACITKPIEGSKWQQSVEFNASNSRAINYSVSSAVHIQEIPISNLLFNWTIYSKNNGILLDNVKNYTGTGLSYKTDTFVLGDYALDLEVKFL